MSPRQSEKMSHSTKVPKYPRKADRVRHQEIARVSDQLTIGKTYHPLAPFSYLGTVTVYIGDVKKALAMLPDKIVDCVVTSPPYWRQRDYKHPAQIGQESSPTEYIRRLVDVFSEMKRILKPTGTFFLNVGYKYRDKELLLIPELLAVELQKSGWTLLNIK